MLTLPPEIHYMIFNYFEVKDIRSLSLVNKSFNNIIKTKEILQRALCLEACPTALPLEYSWKRRWQVMSDFSEEACNQYSIDLTPFFDLGLQVLPDSPSFFQDEILLVNKEASQIYRCNYLTEEIRELDCKIDDKIHQIYCSDHTLAIASGTELIIHNLKNNQEVNRYDKFPSPGWIKFFNGNQLVYFTNSPQCYYLFKNIKEQPDILNDDSQYFRGIKKEERPNDIYYDGQFFIRKNTRQSPDHLWGVEATDCLNKKFSYHSVKSGCGQPCSQTIISSDLFAFATYSTLDGTEFNLNSYKNKRASKFSTSASFKMERYYTTAALYASKDCFIVGLSDINKYHSLAFWNYKNQVVLFESAYRINYLIVSKGTILTSNDGKTLTLFDFTGKKITKPSVKNKFQVVKSPNFLMKKIQAVTNYLFLGPYYRYMADVSYFYSWGSHSSWNYLAIVIRTGQEILPMVFIAFIFFKAINILKQSLKR